MRESTHKRRHGVANPSDHLGIVGATEDNFVGVDGNGLPKDSGSKSADFSSALHAAQHTDGTDDIQDATAAQKGLATATQITKLDGIEEAADVTDATNVANAGAVMDSDFTAIGDLLAGAGVGSQVVVTVGANDTVLTADSTQAEGVRWVTPAGSGDAMAACWGD